MLKHALCLAATLTVGSLTNQTQACDFHDGAMFGAFSMNHPLMQRNRYANEPAQLVLKHDRYKSVKLNRSEVIDINYELPLNFRNVTLRFSVGEGIELADASQVEIDKLAGQYALKYTAVTAGQHIIKVEAEALRDGVPYSHIQRIRLIAQ